MSWTYQQGTGRYTNAAGTLISTGYAGSGIGKNNPAMQSVRNVGPLPCGWYTFGEPVNDSRTGHYTIPLIPDETNEMFGRDEFKMHGDSIESPGNASEGCIVNPLFARERSWESADHRLQVIA